MLGSSSTARVTGGDDIMALFDSVLDRVDEAVEASVSSAQDAHLADMREEARSNPRWGSLAGSLASWEDEDGGYAFGVPDDAPEAPQAVLAEYGDERHAPTALVRRGLTSRTSEMRWAIEDGLQERGF